MNIFVLFTWPDVIDWILDNLIDKNRTRRAVIKKMKELGLIFKAPTRKSVAAAVNKHLWKHEEDTLLKELYDEHRLDDGMSTWSRCNHSLFGGGICLSSFLTNEYFSI